MDFLNVLFKNWKNRLLSAAYSFHEKVVGTEFDPDGHPNLFYQHQVMAQYKVFNYLNHTSFT
jgi:hypothetical protein